MDLLRAYFSSQLVTAGFPDDLEIRWSLGYCQGDGMAFYGKLYPDDLCRLFNNIYPNTKRKQKMFSLLAKRIMEWEDMSHFTIYRNSFGYRYSHFNTMEIDLPKSDGLYFFTEPEARQDWYFPRTKVNTYQVLWDEFVTDLERYIRDTSRQLESAGYGILESTPYEKQTVYQFNTAQFSVELITAPVDFSYFFNYEDDEDMQQLCQSLIDKRSQCAEVYAVVRDRRTNIALGESDWINLVFDTDDNRYSGYKSELISEAIQHAKQNIHRYSQTFSRIRPLTLVA